MRIYLIIFCFFVGIVTFAQSSRNYIEEIYEEEVEENIYQTRKSHSSLYQFTSAQQVPQWFLHPPVSDNNSVYSIGISDPAMDSTEGFKMALYRAEIMASVMRKSLTQLLCDFFLDESENTSNIVYENYSRILSRIPFNRDTCEIVETYYNDFDEVIVLIRYNYNPEIPKEETNTIQLEVYKNEVESSIYGDYESVYEMLIKNIKPNSGGFFFYQLTELGIRNSVSGSFDSLHYELPIYSLSYEGFPNSDSTVNIVHFSHGLWKEFFKHTVNQIVGAAREKPENVSVLSDKYQTESYQKLTRGISKNLQRFVLSSISARGEDMQVKLTEVGNIQEE